MEDVEQERRREGEDIERRREEEDVERRRALLQLLSSQTFSC